MSTRTELVKAFINSAAHMVVALDKLLTVLLDEPAGEQVSTVPEPRLETAQEITLGIEEIRRVLAEKSRAGLQPEVKALILSYGVDRLTDVAPDKYLELMEKAEGLS